MKVCRHCGQKAKTHYCRHEGRMIEYSESSGSGDFVLSAVIGFAADSAILGGLLGGSLLGGLLGDASDGDVFD